MTRRIIAIVLVVLGLGTTGAAIASATVWKPDSIVTVPLPEEPTVSYVITEPGVLNIVNPNVSVKAVAQDPESPVFLGIGRTADVEAWVEQSDHGRITGLETWEELTYETTPAIAPEVDEDEEDGQDETDEEEEPRDANPADSDMWVEEVNGVGEVTYSWSEVSGNWSMIVATDGTDPAPMVELTWEREVPTPALIPGIILGSLLLIGGLVLLALTLLAARRAREQVEPDEAELEEESGLDLDDEPATPEEIMAGVEAAARTPEPVITTGEFEQVLEDPAVDESYPHALSGPEPSTDEPESNVAERPLTRREIREQERARERAQQLSGASSEPDPWPIQGEEHGSVPVEARKPRRWWQRQGAPQEPPRSTGPIILDEDTGEIIITGEIDLSSLNPRATADSWRSTWGLDRDPQTRWRPVGLSTGESGTEEESTSDDDE